jgi:alginate O-acetyltransferase complex protein AlgJ
MIRHAKAIALITAGAAIFGSLSAAPFETVLKNYNRVTSRVMIRTIATPTLANLDYAAYTANPIRFDHQAVTPKKPARKVGITNLTFGGALASACVSLSQTPLSAAEKDMPMAWDPLQNKLWEITKSDAFSKVGAKINGEKWADPDVFMAYQEIAAVYLHGRGDSTQVWVKIEFKPWVKFLDPGIPDEAKDGFHEIYGRLVLDNVDKTLRQKAFDWIRNDYTRTVLTKDQVVDWANLLASYWYPKLNTDVVDLTGQSQWPTPDADKDAIGELKGYTAKNPLVVIRGNPYGTILYNVFLVDFKEEKPAVNAAPAAQQTAPPVPFDASVSAAFKDNNARFDSEVKTFGDYASWAKKDEPFRLAAASFVKSLPEKQMGFKGKNDWLFFRGEVSYLNCGDMSLQAADKNPIPHLVEFAKFLKSKNISLLFVPVPNKSDVYFDKLPVDNPPKDEYGIVNPYARKFLHDLQNAGVEVVDLLPSFLAAKKDDPKNKEALYQRQDTHWTDRGLEIAAKLIADRIRQYSWYPGLSKNDVSFTVKDTSFMRQGDLVDKLAEADKTAFPAVEIAAKQVHNPDGSLYKGANPESPVMLIGDSFTGVFELIDCKAAGVGAHISANTGIPLDIVTSWGGGPLVRDKFYRARKNNLDKKRVVIYMMVARDLFNYSQLWQPLEMK